MALVDDECGASLLHWCCINGHLPTAVYLLSKGVDVNVRSFNKSTPVMWATMSGDVDLVRLLVEEGARVFGVRDESGSTVLHFAAHVGQMDLLEYLCEDVGLNSITKTRDYNGVAPADVAKTEQVARYLKSFSSFWGKS